MQDCRELPGAAKPPHGPPWRPGHRWRMLSPDSHVAGGGGRAAEDTTLPRAHSCPPFGSQHRRPAPARGLTPAPSLLQVTPGPRPTPAHPAGRSFQQSPLGMAFFPASTARLASVASPCSLIGCVRRVNSHTKPLWARHLHFVGFPLTHVIS